MTAAPPTAPGADGVRTGRPTQDILTVFGLYARGEGNWLSVASVVALLADLGVDGPAVRTSISRLKRREVLRSERRAGAAGYALAEPALDLLADGDARIFAPARATEADGWAVVVFNVPEAERGKRHALRSALTRLGFGTAAPGVRIAPGPLAEEARHALQRLGLDRYADVFTGRHVGFGEPQEKVRSWWDLDELAALYREFLDGYGGLPERLRARGAVPRDAFRAYVPMLTAWRRLPYRDPGLPLRLLPDAWPGQTAARLFADLHAVLAPAAHSHARSVLHPTP